MLNKEDIKNIKIIFFDFDGVFTDNMVYVNEKGEESVKCYRSDGIGLKKLKELKIKLYIISTEKNNVVLKRAKKLNIPAYNNVQNKKDIISNILTNENLTTNESAFVGNDINDFEALNYVNYPFCVSDAFNEIKKISKYITKKKGGKGAVREICDLIYNSIHE